MANFWTYAPKAEVNQDKASFWEEQARQAMEQRKLPVDYQQPTIMDKPLLDPSQMDEIQQEPPRPVGRPQGGGGLLSKIGDVVSDAADTAFMGPVNKPWDVLRPIAKLQGAENKYISKPLASGVYSILSAGPNELGAGLPSYEHLPGIVRAGFETALSPSTWVAPILPELAVARLARVAPELAAALPAADGLFAGIGSKRAVAQTLAISFGGPIGSELGEKTGLPGGALIGGLGAGILAAKPFNPVGLGKQTLATLSSLDNTGLEDLKAQLRYAVSPAGVQAMKAEEAGTQVSRIGQTRTRISDALHSDLADSLILAKVKNSESLTQAELPRATRLLNKLEQGRPQGLAAGFVSTGRGPDFSKMSDEELQQLSTSWDTKAINKEGYILTSSDRQIATGMNQLRGSTDAQLRDRYIVARQDFLSSQNQETPNIRGALEQRRKLDILQTEFERRGLELPADKEVADTAQREGLLESVPVSNESTFKPPYRPLVTKTPPSLTTEESLNAVRDEIARRAGINPPASIPVSPVTAPIATDSMQVLENKITAALRTNDPNLMKLMEEYQTRVSRPSATGGPGTPGALYLETKNMQNILDRINQGPSKIFGLKGPSEVIQDAQDYRTSTQFVRQAVADLPSHVPLPQEIQDSLTDFIDRNAKGLGLRLTDSDASLLVNERNRLRNLGKSFAAGAADTARAVITKQFDVAPDGTVQNVSLRYGAPRSIAPKPKIDYLISYAHQYDLTPEQQSAINMAYAPLNQAIQLERDFGIRASKKLPVLPAGGRYVPSGIDTRNLKPDMSFDQAVELRINQAFTGISDKWLSEGLKQLGTSREEIISAGQIGRNELIPGGGQDPVSHLNNSFRGLMATLDGSFGAIQGLITFFNNPVLWLKGMRGAFSSEYYAEAVQRWAETETLGRMTRANVFWAGRNDIGEFSLQRGPFASVPGLKQAANVADSWFTRAGNMFRGLNFEANMPLSDLRAVQTGLSVAETDMQLGRWTNLISGYNPQGPSKLENILFFAPRFFRSQLGLMSDALAGNGISRDLARQSLTKMVLGGSILTYAANEALGNDTDFNPGSPNFMRIRALGQDISVFGPWDSLVRALSTSVTKGPMAGVQYFTSSKASPVMGRVYDLMRHQTMAGDPLDWSDTSHIMDSMVREGKQVLVPIAEQNILRSAQETGNIPQTVGATALQLLGIKSTDLTSAEKRDRLAVQAYGKEWTKLEPSQKALLQQERPEIVTPKARTDFQKAIQLRSQISQRYADLQAKVDQQFPPGPEWRDARSQLLANQAGAFDQWAADHPDIVDHLTTTKADTPEAQALEDYYHTFLQAHAEQWPADTLAQELTHLENSWGPSEQAYVDRNTGLKATPVVKAYRADQKILQPYWQIQDQVFSRVADLGTFTGTKSLNEFIRTKTQDLINQGMDPGVAANRVAHLGTVQRLQSTVSELEARYRRAHPDADAALARWYGYTPIRLQRRAS